MKLLFSDGTSVEVKGAKVPESFAEDGSDVFPVPECIFTFNPRFFEEDVDVSDKEWVKFLDFAHYLHWDEKFYSLIFDCLSTLPDDFVMTDFTSLEFDLDLDLSNDHFPEWWILNKADAKFEKDFLFPLLGDKPYYQEVTLIFKFLRRQYSELKKDEHQFEWENPSLLPFLVCYENELKKKQPPLFTPRSSDFFETPWCSHQPSSYFFEIFLEAFTIISVEGHDLISPGMHLVDLLLRLLPVIGLTPPVGGFSPPAGGVSPASGSGGKKLNTCLLRSGKYKSIVHILMNQDFAFRFPELRKEILSRKWMLLLCCDYDLPSRTWSYDFDKELISFFESIRGGSITISLNGRVSPTFECDGKKYTLLLGEPENSYYAIADIISE